MRGDDDLGVVGRRLIFAGEVGRLVPNFERVRFSLHMLRHLGHVVRPAGDVVHRQRARLIERVPLGIADEQDAEAELLLGEIVDLLVEPIPSPFALLGLEITPAHVRRAELVQPDRGHLGHPLHVVVDRAIANVAAAYAEGAEPRGRLRNVGGRLCAESS